MEDDERPWTEAQWEAAMKRSDLRSARYGELLETMMDDPDRDAKIAHEMGWDEPAEEKDDAPFSMELSDAADDEEITAEIAEREQQLRIMPAYKLARKLGVRSAKALKPLMSKKEKDEDLTEAIGSAFIGSSIAAAKLAGGHAMGYGDDSLCGNIVNNRRGLEGAKQGLNGWQTLRQTGVLPASVTDPIIAEHFELIRVMEERIAELRQRVWW